MKLKDCLCIENVNIDLVRFKSMLEFLTKEFDQYSFEFKEPYDWWESVPNPDYKQTIFHQMKKIFLSIEKLSLVLICN